MAQREDLWPEEVRKPELPLGTCVRLRLCLPGLPWNCWCFSRVPSKVLGFPFQTNLNLPNDQSMASFVQPLVGEGPGRRAAKTQMSAEACVFLSRFSGHYPAITGNVNCWLRGKEVCTLGAAKRVPPTLAIRAGPLVIGFCWAARASHEFLQATQPGSPQVAG